MQDPQQADQALSPITGPLAVDVFGLALAPSFLRAIRSIPSFGIAKFGVNVLPPIPTRMPTKRTAAVSKWKFSPMMYSKMYSNSDLRRKNFLENQEIELGI
jgi:hypothetical protein